jgi:hypothetical protein
MRRAGAALVFAVMLLTGCAVPGSVPATTCPTTFTLNVTPAAGAADHAAMAPGNQQQFVASATLPPTVQGCVYPQVISSVMWTSSDTVDIQLAANPQTSTVVATCLSATGTPATITATQIVTGLAGKATVSMTCK